MPYDPRSKHSPRHTRCGRRNGPFIGGGRILDMDFDDAASGGENYTDDEPVIVGDREELPVSSH